MAYTCSALNRIDDDMIRFMSFLDNYLNALDGQCKKVGEIRLFKQALSSTNMVSQVTKFLSILQFNLD